MFNVFKKSAKENIWTEENMVKVKLSLCFN
jgi:hypothetical protein